MLKKVIAIILFIAGASVSFTAEAKLFDASEFYLDNGLRVIVVPNHKAPIIKHMLWYKVGSADERIGQGGMAHLLEHLMFRGTKKINSEKYSKLIQINGMDGNAFTGKDFTAYHQSLDISRLELAMYLEADRMKNLKLDPKDFELERDIVFQERKQVVENNPTAAFGEALQRLRWQEHPYARPITGMPEEIMNLKLSEIKEFYAKYYTPNNAVLILSGDIDVNTAKTLAKKYYGNINPAAIEKRQVFPELAQNFEANLDMELPNIQNVRIYNSWLAPSVNNDKNNMYNMVLFSKLLGEGKSSVLYKQLVTEKKLALSASSAYDPMGRSYGVFYVSAMPRDGVEPEVLQKEIDKIIQNTIKKLDEKQIEDTKQKLLAGVVYLKDNPNDAAQIVGQMASSGMSLDEIENYADNIAKIKIEDVKNAAKAMFESKSKVSGILRPEKAGQ